MRGTGHITVARGAVVSMLGLAALAGGSVGAWCDLPFKEIVDHVEIVALVEYRKPRGRREKVVAIEIFKGAAEMEATAFDPEELEEFRPRNGDLFLVALTPFGRVVRFLDGMGVCSPVSVLPLRGRKLRAADRFNYDGGSQPLTLDQLRDDLNGPAPPTSTD